MAVRRIALAELTNADSYASRFSRWRVFAFFLAILSLCYSAVLITPYALSDEYANLVGVRSSDKSPFDLSIAGGRPVRAVLVNVFYRCTLDIGDLRYLRLFAVVFVSLLACCLYQAMLSTGWDWRDSIAMALIAVTLPPFQVYVSSADSATYPLSAVGVAAAFYLAEVSLNPRRTQQKWSLAAGSVFLTLLALADFQPSAMIFWVFAALVIFKPDATAAFAVHRLLWYGSIVAVSLALAFGAYRLGVAEYGSLLMPSRVHLTKDIAGKALWFIRSPLIDALNLVWIFSSTWAAVGIAIFVSAGMLLYFEGDFGERLWKYVIALLLLPLSYFPNLVVAEDWSPYRTQAALTCLILLYCSFALRGCVRMLHHKIADKMFTTIVGACALVSICFAAYNVQTYFAIPQLVELRLMRSQMRSGNLAQARSLYVVGSTWHDSIAPAVRYDEFGLPFSAQPWASGPATYLLLRELDPIRSNIPIQVAPVGGPIRVPPGALLVDMRQLSDFH